MSESLIRSMQLSLRILAAYSAANSLAAAGARSSGHIRRDRDVGIR